MALDDLLVITNTAEAAKTFASPVAILAKAAAALKWEDQDVIYLAANYLQENIKRDMQKYGFSPMNLSSFKPANYNQQEFAVYMKNLDYVEQARLEFQIILSSIKSEKLLSEYFKAVKEDAQAKYNYSKMISSFTSVEFDSQQRFNGNSFIQKAEYPVLDNGKVMGKGNFNSFIRESAEKGIRAETLTKDILNNWYKFYFLNATHNC